VAEEVTPPSWVVGEELFRRSNLSSDSVGGLALALPHEGRFPQTGLSRRVFRTGSGVGSDGVSLVGDRWRRRRIDVKRRRNRRGRVVRTSSTHGNRIRHSRKGRGGACCGESPTSVPPRRPERRGGRKRPPRPCHQCLRVCRRCGSGSWEGVGRGGGPAQGGGARARRAPHDGGCSARATRDVGSRSSARGDNPRLGIEGKEGGGERERDAARRPWGRARLGKGRRRQLTGGGG
jgi:hypothetical protein